MREDSYYFYHYHHKQGKQERTYHGGSTSKSSFGALVEVIHGHSAHEGELHMGVGVNASWHDIKASRIEPLGVLWHLEVQTNLSHYTIFAIHISTKLSVLHCPLEEIIL